MFELIGFVTLVSSAIYLLLTRNFGTPLNDSYSAEQRKIKQESAKKRRRAYYKGIGIALILYYIIKRDGAILS